MKINKKVLKNLNKIFKKQKNLLSSYDYDEVVKLYFKSDYEYSNKNLQLFFDSLVRLDPDNKYTFLTPYRKLYVVENKTDENDDTLGVYNHFFNKITIFKHTHKNTQLNNCIDFVVMLHETMHYFHATNNGYKLYFNKDFESEIDKLLSVEYVRRPYCYVNFEELITRMQTVNKFYELMQRNAVPTSPEAVFAIMDNLVDCYTYKYAIEESTHRTIVNNFECYKAFVKPEFDVDFCCEYFLDEYYIALPTLNKNQRIDLDKFKEELTELATKFDENAHKLLELAGEFFPSKTHTIFNPTKNVANAIWAIEKSYAYTIRNKTQEIENEKEN